MSDNPSLYQVAKGLARNPLGIIALFIVLVYAVASVVISLAEGDFYANPYHPSILFLSFFPAIVLFVFSYLVARHHMKLYGPSDYKNQEDFFRGIKIPSALNKNTQSIATSDRTGVETNKDTMELIDHSYKKLVESGFVLVHLSEVLQARTSPNSGRYRVRVWVEPIDRTKKPLTAIESVTYHVWEDFDKPVVTTTDPSSNFDLWMTVYGEFPVLAVIKTKIGETIELQRFIDLPGRPPD